ncbi:MAG: hydantoinase/oxoprolinase family protein [Proteobacteria bacterium]|nr:hydantoinase/oxoprolinase family protein [Pseudomonadota bacterium]
MPLSLKIAADIGGTFTDIVMLLADGTVAMRKVPSTPDDYGRGVVEGIQALVADLKLPASEISEVLHGCTVATNAILEKKGARTALLTTRGFRDVLEFRRIRVPRLYDPLYRKPEPLAPRNLRLEITERVAADGSIVTPLDEADVRRAIETLRREKVEAVAVCFLHSYANPAHERLVAEMLRRELPNVFVTLSVDVLPEIREYERTSTAVINAYVGPPVATYIRNLETSLKRAGIGAPLLVMQSSGGILDAATVTSTPARIIECGPAAGVIGAAYQAAVAGYANVIAFDMGGTTAKASLIEQGRISRTDEYEVGGGISLSSRLVKGGGYALKLPVIDISEVGAGGGSIVWFDKGGALKVGPESAGAVPGPACYDMGGTAATVTDANVVLGFLNPEALAGGTVPIKAQLSRDVIARNVAEPLGVSLHDAAWWVHVVADSNMMRAVKAVSTYRGRDPSDFVLMAFGGNGGIFAVELARQLQIKRVVVPPAAGVFSAVGLCVAEMQFSQSHAFLHRLSLLAPETINAALDGLAAAVLAKLQWSGKPARTHRTAAMRYVGQAFELPVDLPDRPITAADLRSLAAAFEQEHMRTYGHRSADGSDVEIVAIEIVAAVVEPDAARPQPHAAVPPALPLPGTRLAHFGPAGSHRTPVLRRAHLSERPTPGPLIIEEYEGTAVVPPGASAWLDHASDIIIDVGP